MIKSLNSALFICAAVTSSASLAESLSEAEQKRIEALTEKQDHPLTSIQKNVALIAAYAAEGDIPGLRVSLVRGLDEGMTVSESREVLVQVYAYAGFPRSLNALSELMQLIETRQRQGKHDVQGQEPSPVPAPEDMMAEGTRTQTALVGRPVKGPLFDFSPATDQYLKAHLFGDIFARDNLNWKSRELATVGALSAMTGVGSQLKAHLGMSMNVGLTYSQLSELIAAFTEAGKNEWVNRLRNAMETIKPES